MCPACEVEYNDPSNRRFHAQPNACPLCGPRLWVVPSTSASEATTHPFDPKDWPQGEDALRLTKEAFDAGEIVAIKGVGGFHLACDATNRAAVA